MADYSLEFSFEVDNGELDGIARHDCFVLGFELGELFCRLKYDQSAWKQLIHIDNADRCKRACKHFNRECGFRGLDDKGEEWLMLHVSGVG